MRVIRFNYNYGRAELTLPRVKLVPGLESWVEIQGAKTLEVRGIEGELLGNRFMISQIIDDVIVVVDGVCYKFTKHELAPEIEVEEIEVPEFNYGSVLPIEELKEAVKEHLVGYIDTKFQDEGLAKIVEEKAAEVLPNLVEDATESDIRDIFANPVINNNVS